MIKVETKSRRNNYIDIKVRAIISQLPGYCNDIEGAARVFDNDLAALPRTNTSRPSDFYKREPILSTPVEKSFQVWHLNIKGEKDRLVSVITES